MTRAAAVPVLLGAALVLAGAPGSPTRWEKTTHDFGAIDADAKVSYRWPLWNDGDAPLEVLNTFPSCGCTASLIETEAIPPHASGSLLITFDAAGQHGDVRKSITVVTSDPVKPRTILTILARVRDPVDARVSKGHPAILGQSMLGGTCASCHAEPARGKTGAPLFSAVCAMCHGEEGGGGKLGPSLRDAGYLASKDDAALAASIAYGTTNPRMPGFSQDMGGPLDRAQIVSLVKLLRTRGAP